MMHEKIENFIEIVNKNLNGLDILINNAGITLDNFHLELPKKIGKKFLI